MLSGEDDAVVADSQPPVVAASQCGDLPGKRSGALGILLNLGDDPLSIPCGEAAHTAYSGNVALPPELAAELELPFVIRSRSALADGTVVAFNVHSATVVRDGRPRYIDIDAVGVAPLLGMDLMDSHSLYVEITDGGRVIIEPMG